MDIHARLKSLMNDRGWTEYRLAKECGLSESTIANIFRRNCTPSFSTLETICSALGITMAQFFSEGEMIELTPDIKLLFENYIGLTPEQKKAVMQLIKTIKQSNSTISSFLPADRRSHRGCSSAISENSMRTSPI